MVEELTNDIRLGIICLTREPEGECRSPDPVYLILSY